MRVGILGGTRGLGFHVATESLRRGHETFVTGRATHMTRSLREALPGAHYRSYDLLQRLNPVSAAIGLTTQELAGEAAAYDLLFLVAGTWLRRPFGANDPADDISRLVQTHLVEPMRLLNDIVGRRTREGRPLNLVVVSSSSATKVRDDGQAAYGAAQAGKAHFTRNLAAELVHTLPGSRVLLACPGGMKTEFFRGTDVDTSGFADPAEVAQAIWENWRDDNPPFVELDIRQVDGALDVKRRP